MDRAMNENSLANLSKPKEKREGYGYRYTIPQEKIDELFSYIADNMTLKAAAKKANMCFATAKKYYKQGDVKRGIKPLQMRLEVFQEKVNEKMNVLFEEKRSKRIDFVQKLIEKVEEKLVKSEEEGGIDLENVTIRDLERLIKLEAFLSGTVKTTTKETKMLSADDIGAD